jgi:hypothetical protein
LEKKTQQELIFSPAIRPIVLSTKRKMVAIVATSHRDKKNYRALGSQ